MELDLRIPNCDWDSAELRDEASVMKTIDDHAVHARTGRFR